MSTNNIKRKIEGFGILFSLLFSFMLLSATEADAQWRDNRRIVRNTRINNNATLVRTAQAQGYNDGLRDGNNDAHSRRRHNPYGKSRYRRATSGYNSRLGNRAVYQQAYRQAFVRGYNEGYRRNNRNIRIRRSW